VRFLKLLKSAAILGAEFGRFQRRRRFVGWSLGGIGNSNSFFNSVDAQVHSIKLALTQNLGMYIMSSWEYMRMEKESSIRFDYSCCSVTILPAARWQVIRQTSQISWIRQVCLYFSEYSAVVLDLRGVSILPASKRSLRGWLAGNNKIAVIGLGAIL
jgi:hypothetical protein